MNILVILLSIILLTSYSVGSSSAQLTPHKNVLTESIQFEKSLKINILLFGDSWSEQNISNIKSKLFSSYGPYVFSTEGKLGIKYKYEYNFYSGSETDNDKLFTFMKQNSISHKLAGSVGEDQFMQAWWVSTHHPELTKSEYRLIDAEKVEKYLYDNFIAKNNVIGDKNSVNLIFLKGDNTKVSYLHNYYVSKYDDSRKDQHHNEVGLMGYGGNFNLYFFDLYAVPWVDFDFIAKQWYVPETMNNLHDCKTDGCFEDIVSQKIKSAIHHIITPFFVYPIIYRPKYLVDILIYSKPGMSIGLTPQTAVQFINTEKIKSELSELYPYSQWDVRLSIEKRSDRGLTYEFKKALEDTRHETIHDIFGNERAIELYSSQKLQPYLISYGSDKLSTSKDPDTAVIPVLLVVDSTDHFVYLDNIGIMGFAAPLNSDKTMPCCALAIINEKTAWDKNVGSTNLVLHEIGHVMGLGHPFQSWSPDGTILKDPYWNWYSSPMTYNTPPNGCGFVYSLIYSNPCGLGSASFTEFEKSRILDATFVSLVKDTNSKISKDPTNENNAKLRTKLNEAISRFNEGDSKSAVFTLTSVYEQGSKSITENVAKPNLSSPTKFGTITINTDVLFASRYSKSSLVISGMINDQMGGHPVVILITKPDGKTFEIRTIPGKNGYYETTLNIDSNYPIGIYRIDAKYIKEKSNSVWFTIKDAAVEKSSETKVKKSDKKDLKKDSGKKSDKKDLKKDSGKKSDDEEELKKKETKKKPNNDKKKTVTQSTTNPKPK